MAGVASTHHRKLAMLEPLCCYRLDEMIGNGTFSEVYRATHLDTNEVVALKCFRQQMKTMAHYRAAAREIAFMKILDHPNILPLKKYEISRAFVFIGTEFAAFGSLRTFLQDKQPLAEAVIQMVMKQILSALDYMHTLGVFHGDIKPHNILCTNMKADGPVVKICDFGLTEIKLKGCDMSFKAGSFLFMAPEIHLRHPVDVSCDLWSAGVVMYFMMFTRTLFNLTDKDREKQIGLMKRRVKPSFSGSELYSSNCNNLVQSLLSYDKQNRPQGETLRKHPFLNLEYTRGDYGETFLTNARTNIAAAFVSSQNKKYGHALVEGIQAILELKIHHNLIKDDHLQRYFRRKWVQYEDFTLSQERALVIAPDMELDYSQECLNDTELRKHLVSTPKLLDGFDIGCNAEMFLMEGNKEKALSMFHQALQVLLPLMKTEPKSNRKEVLGKRLRKWIQEVEYITNGPPANNRSEEAMSTAMASIPGVSTAFLAEYK